MEQSEKPPKQPRKEEDYQELNKFISERAIKTIEENLLIDRDVPDKFVDDDAERMYKWIVETKERDPDKGLFNIIQEGLRSLEHEPDKRVEEALIQGRQVLIREADERGVFDGLKETFLKAQEKNDFELALKDIAKINIVRHLMNLEIQPWWSKDFNGMLDEYKQGALFNMRLADLEAMDLEDGAQAKGLNRKIELRGWGNPPPGLRSLAQSSRVKKEREADEKEDKPEKDTPSTLKEAFRMSEEEVLKEREMWVYSMEYNQELYSKFDPRTLPEFYKRLGREKQKDFDVRWQLARAAYYKKATAIKPDVYRDNEDLKHFRKEQMERLFKIKGVGKMMGGYAQAIVKGNFAYKDGDEVKTFWDIRSSRDFENFRIALRKQQLAGEGLDKLGQIEVDAIAWNMIWIGNLVESANSRYSFTGRLVQTLPGNIMASEYRHNLYPQERFERKSVSGHYWGSYGQWGVEQIKRITSRVKGYEKNKKKYEILFEPGNPRQYWSHKVYEEDENRELYPDKRIIVVQAPECYPVKLGKSYWEEAKSNNIPLLDYLLEEETMKDGKLVKLGADTIEWDDPDFQEDYWGIYAAAKFHKAVKTLENWGWLGRDQVLEEGKEEAWGKNLLELFRRTGVKRTIKDLKRTKGIVKPLQTFKQLKVWAVFASFGGVKNPRQSKFVSPLPEYDRKVMQTRLSSKNVGYIKGGTAGFGGDKLEIK